MRSGLWKYAGINKGLGINELQVVRGCWGDIYIGDGCGRILEYISWRYCIVYCGGVNWPPNHPGGVALIKPKNKRLGCEPMRKH